MYTSRLIFPNAFSKPSCLVFFGCKVFDRLKVEKTVGASIMPFVIGLHHGLAELFSPERDENRPNDVEPNEIKYRDLELTGRHTVCEKTFITTRRHICNIKFYWFSRTGKWNIFEVCCENDADHKTFRQSGG